MAESSKTEFFSSIGKKIDQWIEENKDVIDKVNTEIDEKKVELKETSELLEKHFREFVKENEDNFSKWKKEGKDLSLTIKEKFESFLKRNKNEKDS
ncbi:hypothetical protein OO013_01205 [Mangrovivirga sp. M17]|uniref:Uncharacterized protein n=1 Tax=Mangrovivirga halotolerans TaxID=2993936 RepID=A0ABT3RL73_9BACT|nr:hypothetical protein [Mangrovivirga halotolerans]MCX2742459.1 hypothetical protein [Mangrovivirga halotolerans]